MNPGRPQLKRGLWAQQLSQFHEEREEEEEEDEDDDAPCCSFILPPPTSSVRGGLQEPEQNKTCTQQ